MRAGDRALADFRVHAIDWAILRRTRSNALLVGPREATEAAVASLLPDLSRPVVAWQPDNERQPITSGTVVIRDIDTFDSVQQHRLLEWLDGLGAVQILSFASRPVHPLVRSGVFLDALYYRLNVVYLELGPPSSRS